MVGKTFDNNAEYLDITSLQRPQYGISGDKSEVFYTDILKKYPFPEFENEIEAVSTLDGCKVYFKNGDFVICRFSGTEPLLRIFAESNNKVTAAEYIKAFKDMLKL